MVNYLPRVVPMVILSRLKIPDPVIQWLELVPAAVLAAIVVPSLLMPENQLNITLHNKYLLASIPTIVAAKLTSSLVWTLLLGMVTMAILQQVI